MIVGTSSFEAPVSGILEAVRGFADPEILAVLQGRPLRARKQAVERLRRLVISLEAAARSLHGSLDPVPMPENVFDPTSPDVAAWTVVLALLGQERVPLANVVPEYGAGVYALYYLGDHPDYASVKRTETPIYVGKADPARGATADVRTHGATLSGRLLDHRRQIKFATTYGATRPNELTEAGLYPLLLEDFECRKLVCAPGVQLTAEARLINLFRPIWNSDFNVAYGVSKHGDRQRKHPKSPWDVLHPGREWATGLDEDGNPFRDQDTPVMVRERIANHIRTMTIFDSQAAVISAVLRAFGQKAATADAATAERMAQEAEASGITGSDSDS